MSRSTPSLLALLGLVAVAGYQNRDKISEMLTDARGENRRLPPDPEQRRADHDGGGFLSELGRMFGAGTTGSTISTALDDLMRRFKEAGPATPADSWVSTDANAPIDVEEMEAALGHETLDELAEKTGLSRAELLERLKSALPEVVNSLTPQGRLPTETEAQAFG